MASLSESLNKFKHQQEKCQSTLTGVAAARAASSKASRYQKDEPLNTSSSSSRAAAGSKFSDDTTRLKHINSIRKLPVGAQLKRVIDILYQTREALTAEQINEACFVDVYANQEVFDNLKTNLVVHYDGRHFCYKSKYDVKDQKQLLELIRKYPEGIATNEMKDAYASVMNDLEALKSSHQIWLLSSQDSQKDSIAYPNDPKVPIMKVDNELKQLFLGTNLPVDMVDIERDLQKNGFKPATNTALRKALAQVQGIPATKPKTKKKREISKRTKLTNAHLPELFQNLNVPDP